MNGPPEPAARPDGYSRLTHAELKRIATSLRGDPRNHRATRLPPRSARGREAGRRDILSREMLMAKDIEEGPTTNPKGPAKLTVYPASFVKDHGPNDTGIFFPDKYVPGGTLDLLVYFHGLPTPCGGQASDKIWDFWRSSTFRLREWVNKSGKNVVLVAPRLRGDEGGLHLDMAADEFLKQVVAWIAARVKTDPFNWQGTNTSTETKDSTGMSIGKLILAAHSGGGSPMLLMARTAKFAKVRECWGFDSMYGSPDTWVDWAAQGGKYFLFWTDEGANNSKKYGSNVTAIQNILNKANIPAGSNPTKDPDAARAALAAPNVVIVYAPKPDDAAKGFATPPGRKFAGTTTNHCEMPQTYWADMMNSF
jgi:hypothetical protein